MSSEMPHQGEEYNKQILPTERVETQINLIRKWFHAQPHARMHIMGTRILSRADTHSTSMGKTNYTVKDAYFRKNKNNIINEFLNAGETIIRLI